MVLLSNELLRSIKKPGRFLPGFFVPLLIPEMVFAVAELVFSAKKRPLQLFKLLQRLQEVKGGKSQHAAPCKTKQ